MDKQAEKKRKKKDLALARHTYASLSQQLTSRAPGYDGTLKCAVVKEEGRQGAWCWQARKDLEVGFDLSCPLLLLGATGFKHVLLVGPGHASCCMMTHLESERGKEARKGKGSRKIALSLSLYLAVGRAEASEIETRIDCVGQLSVTPDRIKKKKKNSHRTTRRRQEGDKRALVEV